MDDRLNAPFVVYKDWDFPKYYFFDAQILSHYFKKYCKKKLKRHFKCLLVNYFENLFTPISV